MKKTVINVIVCGGVVLLFTAAVNYCSTSDGKYKVGNTTTVKNCGPFEAGCVGTCQKLLFKKSNCTICKPQAPYTCSVVPGVFSTFTYDSWTTGCEIGLLSCGCKRFAKQPDQNDVIGQCDATSGQTCPD